MEKISKENFNEVSGGILGNRSADAMSRYEACKKAKELFGKNFPDEFAGGEEAKRLRMGASFAYQKGLVAQMSGTEQELDDRSINALNNYSDWIFNAIKKDYPGIK